MQTNYISASFNPQVPKLQSDEKQSHSGVKSAWLHNYIKSPFLIINQ